MKRLVSVDLGNGESMFIEVEQPMTEQTIDIGLPAMAEKAKVTFADSVEKVLPVAKILIQRLHSIDENLQELEVSFGFNLNAQADAIIASSSVGANFSVALRWSKSE